jgi:serine/threonine protein kinase/class 3 adenylate cyclase
MAELRTFLFTDICGSVRLKNEMIGRSVSERDLAFINSILTPHRQRIEAQLEEFGGRVVSTAGDGHFLVFDHTVQAALWAVAVQESHRDEPILAPNGDPVEVRISIHSGVPQTDPGDPNNFIGKSVDYASRLNDYATGGQILISRSVMAILDDVGLEGIRLHVHGRRNLKGIGNVEVHELLYGEHGPRPLRNQPKSNNTERQWTVVPTMGFDDADTGGGPGGLATARTLTHVGNYQLEELLGSGGMGDVYKARHTQFGRVRAVKVIKQQYVSSGHTEVIRRFYNEIKAVGRLEHRNIVVAIDSSAPTDDVHYLVMEYIEGVSLDELVAQHGPLPIAEACEVIRQAARGLQFIHKNDMVHRDIKPSNLMITLVDGELAQTDSTLTQGADGQRAVVKILDLGLALLADDSHDRLTRMDHKAMGTGMYMSPEQWRTSSVDIRADIYSLGCTLYHLLAGNPPYYDSDLRPEKAHEKSQLPMIRSSSQPVPKKLWDVVRKMLEKRPDDRFTTPAEVAAALAPFADGNGLAAFVRGHQTGETPSVSTRETKPDGAQHSETWRSRPWFSGIDLKPSRRWLMQAGLPLALVALFGGAALFVINERRVADQKIADAAKQQAEALKTRAEEEARKSLSSFAKHAARKALPEELAKRFGILTAAASSPELIAALSKLNTEVPAGTPTLEAFDPSALEELDKWIATLSHRSGNAILVDSWFVNNKYGIQVARSPADERSIGGSYRHRDYFHGLRAQDFDPEKDEDRIALESIGPIDHNNLSLVYRSSTSGLLKVAFSVPIWNRPADVPTPSVAVADDRTQRPATPGSASVPPVAASTGELNEAAVAPQAEGELPPREVIGVLAMSVNVHEFNVLEAELAGGSEVVLIDLRADFIEKEAKSGLILHHPRLEKGQLARVPQDLLDTINEADPNTEPNFDGFNHFLDGEGYHDPLNPDTSVRYWGAFEPVRYEIGDAATGVSPTDRVGWVVLVQKRMLD